MLSFRSADQRRHRHSHRDLPVSALAMARSILRSRIVRRSDGAAGFLVSLEPRTRLSVLTSMTLPVFLVLRYFFAMIRSFPWRNRQERRAGSPHFWSWRNAWVIAFSISQAAVPVSSGPHLAVYTGTADSRIRRISATSTGSPGRPT